MAFLLCAPCTLSSCETETGAAFTVDGVVIFGVAAVFAVGTASCLMMGTTAFFFLETGISDGRNLRLFNGGSIGLLSCFVCFAGMFAGSG